MTFAVAPDGTEKWSVVAQGPFALGQDGTLYAIGAQAGMNVWDLLAVRPDGTIKWTVSGVSAYSAAPALTVDGVIYVTGIGLTMVTADGTATTALPALNDGFTYPAIASDGTTYLGLESDGALHAIGQ